MDASNFDKQIVELKEQNAKLLGENAKLMQQNGKLIEENAELKKRIDKLTTNGNAESKKRPTAEEEFDVPPSQIKQMKLSSEPESNDLDAEKMETIGEKIITKSKSVLINPNCLRDVLGWIKRTEMADSALSTSSRTFQQLCWPKLHGNVKPHNVGQLEFREDEFDNSRANFVLHKVDISVPIPIASIPPPNYIVGFKQIQICFFNGQIMRFMECIYPLLNQIDLEFDFNSTPFYYLTSQTLGQIHHLSEMLVNKALSLDVSCLYGFLRFQPNANAIIENIQLISTYLNKKNIDLLFKWVAKSRADRKPKMLQLKNYDNRQLATFINRIKKEFSAGTVNKNFLIQQLPYEGKMDEEEEEYPEFVLENEQTNELLSYYTGDYDLKYLVRFPKGNEHLPKEWEKQMVEMIERPPHKIIVSIWEIGEF